MKRTMEKFLLFATICVFVLVCACDSESPKNQQPEETAVISKKISSPKQETAGTRAQSTAEKSGKTGEKNNAASAGKTSAKEKENSAAGKAVADTPKDRRTGSSETEKSEGDASGVKIAQKAHTTAPSGSMGKNDAGSGATAQKDAVKTGNNTEKNRGAEDQNNQSSAAQGRGSASAEKGAAKNGKTTPGENASKIPLEDILMNMHAAYKSAGKIDPFEPLIKTEKEEKKSAEREKEKEKPKRKLTPLEKLDLSQLKLVAVVDVKDRDSFAMVQEASGKGYIVKVGTYIGKNSGRITDITDDKIVIKERFKNFKGEYETDYKEMKLQKKNNQ